MRNVVTFRALVDDNAADKPGQIAEVWWQEDSKAGKVSQMIRGPDMPVVKQD